MTVEEGVVEAGLDRKAWAFPHIEAEQPRDDMRYAYRVAKRLFDIVFSTCVLIILFIPSLILCAAIRAESPGSPIYVQHRVARIGKNGVFKVFPMYKFRSMCKDADSRLDELKGLNEADGPLFKIKEDPRVTRIGRFIRKHSIDEIPQFINCWLGHMSVCGPRPAFLREVEHYDEQALRRLSVKPGVTGYWQICGRSNTSFDDMVQLDLRYIDERSMLTDIRTIIRTVAVVFTGHGAW